MGWCKIKPLTEEEARRAVQSYLEKHSVKVKEINFKDVPEGKKFPDFECFYEKSKFLCEIKTPANKLNKKLNLYLWKTSFYKIRRFLNKARKQFEDYDSSHKYPWILAMTSNHPQLNWTHLRHVIQGQVRSIQDDYLIRDFRNRAFSTYAREDFFRIDGAIWFQISPKDRATIYQIKFFPNPKSKFVAKVKTIFNILIPHQSENISP